MEYKDYYQSLEIDETSSTDEITKVYRKLARKYHPDVNPGDEEAVQRYKDIQEAHQVLANPEARAKYDRLRASWTTHQTDQPETEFDWSQWAVPQAEDGQSSGFSLFFDALFSGIDTSPVDQVSSKGLDYNQQIEISLEESYAGTSRILRIGGRRIEVRIPKGASSGTKVRVRGEGGASLDGSARGDLYLEIVIKPHDYYQRQGDDLHLDLPVNLYTAVLGGEAIVPTLKGKIKLKIPPETQAGRVFRLKGQGMPSLQNAEQRGDLYAKVVITLPENLTDEEIELFEELADIRGL
ncbi:MAG: Curved DNA-binding protein [Anaerolineae bacterium]|nr:Curved DNA-binding protein [Anaerolineae bacterium]